MTTVTYWQEAWANTTDRLEKEAAYFAYTAQGEGMTTEEWYEFDYAQYRAWKAQHDRPTG